jgi:hypothetical protein
LRYSPPRRERDSKNQPTLTRYPPSGSEKATKLAILAASWRLLGATCYQLGSNIVHFASSCCQASPKIPTESSTRPPRAHKTPPDHDFPRFRTPPESIFIEFGTLWTPIPQPFHSASPYQPHNRTNATTHQPHYRNNALVQARWRMLRSTWIHTYIHA